MLFDGDTCEFLRTKPRFYEFGGDLLWDPEFYFNGDLARLFERLKGSCMVVFGVVTAAATFLPELFFRTGVNLFFIVPYL